MAKLSRSALQIRLTNLLWDKFQANLISATVTNENDSRGYLKVKLEFTTDFSSGGIFALDVLVSSEEIVRSHLSYEEVVCIAVEAGIRNSINKEIDKKFLAVAEEPTKKGLVTNDNEWVERIRRSVERLLLGEYYLALLDFKLEALPAQDLIELKIVFTKAGPKDPRLESDNQKHWIKFPFPMEAGSGRSLAHFEKMVLIDVDRALANKFGENNMPVVKKKPNIVRQSPIDTDKIKAPGCPIHHLRMNFDPAAQKFFCPDGTCNQVARPKRDSDDKIVTLGVGQIQLRFIVRPGVEPEIVLISDDNVALKITTYISKSVIYKLAQEMSEKHILDKSVRVEKVVQVPYNRIAGLNFTEMLLMYEPD